MLPDSEGVLRRWAKLKLTSVDGRVHFSVPDRSKPGEMPTLPMIVMYRTSGVPDIFDHDHPGITFEVWSDNKHSASQIATELASLIQEAVYDVTTVEGGVVTAEGVTIGPRPMYPQPSKAFRYEVGADFTVRIP